MTFPLCPSAMSCNLNKTTPASAGRCTRATVPKGDRDAPMCDDNPPSSRDNGDAPPLREGWYATPVTPGHDDKSTSESTSTIRRLPLLWPLLGPQQIDSLMKSQYGRKIGKLPDSFTTILKQGWEETPTPSLTPLSARSNNSGGFKLFLHPKWHARTGQGCQRVNSQITRTCFPRLRVKIKKSMIDLWRFSKFQKSKWGPIWRF